MQLFLDTADVEAIRVLIPTGLIDGVTTNPTHLAKIGKDPKKQILDICALLPDGHVSVEVTEKDPEKIYDQARELAALSSNICVKIPCLRDYYPIIAELADEGIKINVTLVFSLIQGLCMCKLGVTYISPFIGRWDDIDVEGKDLLFEIRSMLDEYGYETKLLEASIRGVRHMHEAILAGADAATVPLQVFYKATQHGLTHEGIASFDRDWNELGIKRFP